VRGDAVVDQLLPHLPATPLRVLYVGPAAAGAPDVLLGRAQTLTLTPLGARVLGSYDLVCAHAALLAVDALRPPVVELCDAVAPGGVVSLLAPASRLEELASYVAGRRMHVEAWYGAGTDGGPVAERRDAPTVHVVGRRDGAPDCA
jgi:hypothetical protein